MDRNRTITKQTKQLIIKALKQIPPLEDGTEFNFIAEDGKDFFEQYPAIRVIPSGITREIDSEQGRIDYKMDFTISVYLELNSQTPTKELIDTITDMTDSILYQLDYTNWLPETQGNRYGFVLVENSTSSTIDIIQTKSGSVLYNDMTYTVSYREPLTL